MREGIALYGGMVLGVVFVGLFGFKGFSQLFDTGKESEQGARQQ
ncbi:MAG TPA: hypothetical protein VNM45_18925 [Bacillus sp. (in: firmicutes)]|nr:hypothetical protein [Bacillus sp. (in: firmicutes)]